MKLEQLAEELQRKVKHLKTECQAYGYDPLKGEDLPEDIVEKLRSGDEAMGLPQIAAGSEGDRSSSQPLEFGTSTSGNNLSIRQIAVEQALQQEQKTAEASFAFRGIVNAQRLIESMHAAQYEELIRLLDLSGSKVVADFDTLAASHEANLKAQESAALAMMEQSDITNLSLEEASDRMRLMIAAAKK